MQEMCLLIRFEDFGVLWEVRDEKKDKDSSEYGDKALNYEDPVLESANAWSFILIHLPSPGLLPLYTVHVADTGGK